MSVQLKSFYYVKNLNRISSRLEAARESIEQAQADGAIPPEITRHRVAGDIMQAGILSYFLLNDSDDRQTARIMDTIGYRLPSYGSFYTTVKTHYQFGLIPRSVEFPGVTMDVNFIETLGESKEADRDTRTRYVEAIGHRASAYEHIVPEQMFSNETNRLQGISAVKALSIAEQQGQRTYTLTQANAAELSNISIDSGARNEIANALNAGKRVTVHEGPITAFGWSGSGYIIIDPETGSGAYKISGGENGSHLLFAAVILISAIAMILPFVFFGFYVALIVLAFEFFSFLSWVSSIESANSKDEFTQASIAQILVAILSLIPFDRTGVAEAVIAQWFGIIFSTLIGLVS